MLKTEAIAKFLHSQPYPLCKLYTGDMEVQVNVSPENGELIRGSYGGKKWLGYTDGINIWKHIRIPWGAKDNPKYTDSEMTYDLAKYASDIGMTGWDWGNKCSRWVGFDFDSLLTHKVGLTDKELLDIRFKIERVEFLNIYTSTSGLGLHAYVFIEDTQAVNNHTEHAAVAKAILNKISALTGVDLEVKVDTLGGNLWVWSKRAGKESYLLLKKGVPLQTLPTNWKEFLPVKTGSRSIKSNNSVDDLANSKQNLMLDDEHIKLMNYLERKGCLWWFDSNRQMLVCHTYDLKLAHRELLFKGIYDTVATGKEQGQDQNCFAFPLPDGGWTVRRHTKNTQEHNYWFTDSSGWTTCYYNRLPSLHVAAKNAGGVEAEKEFTFDTLISAVKALLAMGIDCDIPLHCGKRSASVRQTLENKVIVEFERADTDDNIEGWSKRKATWQRIFYHPRSSEEIELPDHLIRYTTLNEWFIKTNHGWLETSKNNAQDVLTTNGFKKHEVPIILGRCILNSWKLVAKPFFPEYTGNREWNRQAPQFRIASKEGAHPTWDLILNHIGKGLDEVTSDHLWCKKFGINTGVLYLTAWLSCLLKDVNNPLPYLFLVGPQNAGKSILHEVLHLIIDSGIVRADNALTNPSGFNGELFGSILCIVEETNLSKKGVASDRIKDWVTGKTLSIHNKNKTPFQTNNLTHWIQCANSPDYCPTFPGDTRIVVCPISKLEEEIPKPKLISLCEEESAAFLYTLLHFELPDFYGRLRLPVLETALKQSQMAFNRSPLEIFIEETLYEIPGQKVLFSEFYTMFQIWLGRDEQAYWTNRRVSKELNFIKGKWGGEGQLYIGNVSLDPTAPAGTPLRLINGRLT